MNENFLSIYFLSSYIFGIIIDEKKEVYAFVILK